MIPYIFISITYLLFIFLYSLILRIHKKHRDFFFLVFKNICQKVWSFHIFVWKNASTIWAELFSLKRCRVNNGLNHLSGRITVNCTRNTPPPFSGNNEFQLPSTATINHPSLWQNLDRWWNCGSKNLDLPVLWTSYNTLLSLCFNPSLISGTSLCSDISISLPVIFLYYTMYDILWLIPLWLFNLFWMHFGPFFLIICFFFFWDIVVGTLNGIID